MGTVLLKKGNLTLRKHESADAQILYRILGTDPEMSRYTGWNPYAEEEMAKRTVEGFIASYADAHFYGWAIEAEGTLIGTIGAYDYQEELQQVEVGYSIAKGFWGRGYASAALDAVLAYLRREGIRKVTAWSDAENRASVRVLEKNGFVMTGTQSEGDRVRRIYERSL